MKRKQEYNESRKNEYKEKIEETEIKREGYPSGSQKYTLEIEY